MQTASVCIISHDIIELAVMADSMSGKYSVIAAHDYDEALYLMESFLSCRLVYYEVGKDADTALKDMYALGRRGMDVFAMYHPPCHTAVRQATVKGRIQGLCRLPILPESLLAQTRNAFCCMPSSLACAQPDPCHLTQDEIDFLLDIHYE